MKVLSIKLHKGRTIGALLLLAGIGVVAIISLFLPQDSLPVSGKNGAKGEDRVEFLASYGWQVAEPPVMVTEVLIGSDPTKTDYLAYQQLQTEAELDLTPALGKRVKCYYYAVNNHKTGRKDALAILLVEGKKIVAGHIQLGTGEDALRHSLANQGNRPTAEGASTTAPKQTVAAQGELWEFPTD